MLLKYTGVFLEGKLVGAGSWSAQRARWAISGVFGAGGDYCDMLGGLQTRLQGAGVQPAMRSAGSWCPGVLGRE